MGDARRTRDMFSKAGDSRVPSRFVVLPARGHLFCASRVDVVAVSATLLLLGFFFRPMNFTLMAILTSRSKLAPSNIFRCLVRRSNCMEPVQLGVGKDERLRVHLATLVVDHWDCRWCHHVVELPSLAPVEEMWAESDPVFHIVDEFIARGIELRAVTTLMSATPYVSHW